MKSRTGKILLHVLGSLCFLSVPVIFSPDFDLTFYLFKVGPFRRDLLSYILLLGIFYANYYYFIPKFFHPKKYFWFGVITICSFALLVTIPQAVSGEPPRHGPGVNTFEPGPPPQQNFTQPPPGNPPQVPLAGSPRPGKPYWLHSIERNLFRFLIVIVIAIAIQINVRLRQTERDKLDAELSYLKAQINPHFLFNTLNSIYSLAITRSEHTPTAVVKLSEMMRYVTTEAHNDKVPLQKEIDYVTNYVDLQRIRLGSTVRTDYNVKGEPGQKKIAPLVMIPFVENAFKYGVNPEEESDIVISITIEHDRLTMFVKNKVVKVDYGDEYKSGHGMDNVAQRLKMGYPGKHKLNFGRFNNDYLVNLEIEL